MWNDLLQTHGYRVLALGGLLEGETLLVLAGFAARRGLLDPVAVGVIAALAGLAGDQLLFWLGELRHVEGWLFVGLPLALAIVGQVRRRRAARRAA